MACIPKRKHLRGVMTPDADLGVDLYRQHCVEDGICFGRQMLRVKIGARQVCHISVRISTINSTSYTAHL